MIEKRDHFFDNTKFILIFLVVLGHAFEGVNGSTIGTIYRLIYLFHMPCFVFILGYFCKNISARRVVQSVWIYLVFQTLYFMFTAFFLHDPNVKLQYIWPIWILWFSLATVAWQVALPIICIIPYRVILAFIAGIAAGYFSIFSYGLSASRVVVFLPFFLLGYSFKKNWIIRIPPAVAILIFISAYIALKFFINIPVGLLYGSCSYAALGLGSFGGVDRALLYVSSIVLIACFFSLIPKKETWFSRFGARTLNVYLLHGFIILHVKHMGLPQAINTTLERLAYIAGIFGLVLVLSSGPVACLMNKITNPMSVFKNKAKWQLPK
ncbi:hypothetical protein LJC48_07540 [Desulfovibrio sp. OttesenSCG-928-C06]|nr:hypothetical protein [Desulfovibrio sp. OttesenSCG-928-C06]